ncbi:metallophosphoesterase (plasmid) [Methylomarinum sp. Ch1-1]|uniref:Metallophosphoesterase n=1 Tax=Methylomarinum roseum TaxID=3067653 RepID=A0AAU7NP76_9GAMM
MDNEKHNHLLFAGDPHGCFDNLIYAVHKYRPAAVVMLGDYNLEMPLENYLQAVIGMTQIYWIPGNHDFDSQAEYENLYHSAFGDNNLHLKVIEVGGLRIAGLGGIFLGRVWRPGKEPKWPNRESWLACKSRSVKKMPLHIKHAIWHHEFEWMKANIKADILVTHEAPSCHRFGFAVIDELAHAIGAKQVFHGHHHEDYRTRLQNGLAVNGVAMGGVVNLAGEIFT